MSSVLTDYQQLAEQAVKDSRQLQPPFITSFGSLKENPDNGYAIAFSSSNVAEEDDLVTHSNYLAACRIMEAEFPDDVLVTTFSGPLRGVKSYHLLVRMLDTDGKVTEAGKRVLELREQIQDYPALDDDLLSELEFEQLRDWVSTELHYRYNLRDETALNAVLDYLHNVLGIAHRDDLAVCYDPIGEAMIELELERDSA